MDDEMSRLIADMMEGRAPRIGPPSARGSRQQAERDLPVLSAAASAPGIMSAALRDRAASAPRVRPLSGGGGAGHAARLPALQPAAPVTRSVRGEAFYFPEMKGEADGVC
jgi:hypothetical protein